MPDYIFSDSDRLPTRGIDQWDANIAAIRTLRAIEAEGRAATPEDQAVLARYSGFGNSAFAQAFSSKPSSRAWAERRRELQELVSPDEFESIRGSRLNAFYTTAPVINQMWSSLTGMGAGDLKNPVVLEPSAGSGRFLGLQPPEMARRSKRIAVELDSLTGSITKHAYPDTQVHVAGYEDVHIPNDYVDIAISNVPFGNYPIHDAEYSGQGYGDLSIHNYFFAKTVDKLKPGGVAAFITTHYTMDSPQAKDFRESLAQQADFLGAVRLPQNAFPDTQVVTDIIYLRKRDPKDRHPVNREWVETEEVELPTKYTKAYGRYGPDIGTDPQPYNVNSYYRANPGQMLGVQDGTGTMRGPNQYTVRGPSDRFNAEKFDDAHAFIVDRAPQLRTKAANASPAADVKLKRDHAAETAAVAASGSYRTTNGAVERMEDGAWQPSERNQDDQDRIRGMLSVRDDVRALMDLELSGDADDDAIGAQRAAARQTYADFVAKFGDLNAKKNLSAIAGDPDAHFLRGLEVLENDQWRGSDIFQRRTFSPAASYNAGTPEEALAVSLNVKGRVDVDYMAAILGMPRNEVVQSLVSSGQIFLNPETRAFERRAQYLSGTVKSKLEAAQAAAEANPSYRANIQALEGVQPERIGAGDIYLSMGSSWIPQDIMNEGLAQVLSGHNRYDREIWRDAQTPRELVAYSAETGTWGPSMGMIGRRSSQNAAWGTEDVPAAKIIEHAVSNRPLRVNVKDDEGKTRFDEVATRAAKQKIDEMRAKFTEWAWEDPERTARLEEVYNESQNVSIPRQYDASHLTFPGMTAKWQKQMLPHQREAVDRVVQDGNVMLAHEVGFGKTASMVAASMERKRLGLSQKPMFVLPNATAAQFAADFREMYPAARILFEENIGTDNRKAFLDRVRNNDWDAVLVTYSQFERIPVTTGTLGQYQDLMMEQMDAGLRQAKTEGNEYREKQIQNLKKKADTAFKKKREKLELLFDQGAVPFEQLGVDQLFVDEADNFKNLAFFTGLDNIKGLNPTTQSMRGWDMFMKSQLLQGRAGRIRNAKGEALRGGVVFATGSSISNSLAEMWTMMRYLHLDELEKRGLDTFDAWAGNYGRMEEAIEVRASGEYKPTTRFSKFANLPELSALWQGVADIRVQSELPVMLERQPRLVDNDGNPKRVNVQAPKTPAVEAYMKHISTRAEELDSDTKRDNMLKLSGDARKASLDVRFAPPFADSKYPWPPPAEAGVVVEANPQGKIPLLVDRVSRIYQEESEAKGTQLVFLDMGTPSAKEKDGEATSKDADEQDELELDRDDQANLKETYDMIRRALEAKGIPSNEIAFIHDFKKNEQKQRLFRQVRDGQIRVLLGSTNKLGVGVNVQDRLAAVHHMDVPWRPRDVEQREGRIIRAGNKVYGPQFDQDSGEMIEKGLGVKIFKYIQQGSFDEFMWQAVEKKAAGIKAITKRNVTARESDDLDEFVLSASEARALASGDPRAVELVTLETKLAGMKLDRAAYESQRANAQSQIGTLTRRIDALGRQMPNYERDAALAASVLEKDELSAYDAEGQPIAKRPDAERDFKELLASTPFGQEKPLGTYKGFKVHGGHGDTGYRIILESTGTGQKYTSNSFDNPASTNVLVRVDNVINGMISTHADKAEQLAGAQASLKSYRTQLDKPYDQLGEVTQMERRVRNLRANVQGVSDVKEGTEGASVEFSREKLAEEDIEKATDDDMIEAEQRVLSQVMERRREDRSYQTPAGAAFDGMVSEALQDILDERRQKETGVDPHVDPALMDDVPESVPADLRDDVATAIEEPYDIDPGDAAANAETTRREDLEPGEAGDVVERVAERVQLEAEGDEPEERPKSTVVSLEDVDAMLQEEMKDEGIEEGIIPQHADTDYAEDGPDDASEAPLAQEPPATEEPAQEPDAEPEDQSRMEAAEEDTDRLDIGGGRDVQLPVEPDGATVEVGDPEDLSAKYQKRRLVPVRLPQGGTSYVLADPEPVEEVDTPSPVSAPVVAMPAEARMEAEVAEDLDQREPDSLESGPEAWEPADAEERRLATMDTLEAMSDETRGYHDDVLYPRLSDVADEYDTSLMAMRLGADPDPADVDREEAALRRKVGLESGQADMFGATAAEPDVMTLPPAAEPAPLTTSPEIIADTGAVDRGYEESEVTADRDALVEQWLESRSEALRASGNSDSVIAANLSQAARGAPQRSDEELQSQIAANRQFASDLLAIETGNWEPPREWRKGGRNTWDAHAEGVWIKKRKVKGKDAFFVMLRDGSDFGYHDNLERAQFAAENVITTFEKNRQERGEVAADAPAPTPEITAPDAADAVDVPETAAEPPDLPSQALEDSGASEVTVGVDTPDAPAQEMTGSAEPVSEKPAQSEINARVALSTLDHALNMGGRYTPINPVEVEHYADMVQAGIESGAMPADLVEQAQESLAQAQQKLAVYHDRKLQDPELRRKQQRQLSRMANALADPRRASQQEDLIANTREAYASASPTIRKLVDQIIADNVQSGKSGDWALMQRTIGGADAAPVTVADDPYPVAETPESPAPMEPEAQSDADPEPDGMAAGSATGSIVLAESGVRPLVTRQAWYDVRKVKSAVGGYIVYDIRDGGDIIPGTRVDDQDEAKWLAEYLSKSRGTLPEQEERRQWRQARQDAVGAVSPGPSPALDSEPYQAMEQETEPEEDTPRPTPLVPDEQSVAEAVMEEEPEPAEEPEPQEDTPRTAPLVPDAQSVADAVMEDGQVETPRDVMESALEDMEGRPEMDPAEVEAAVSDYESAGIMDAMEPEAVVEEDAPPKKERRTKRKKAAPKSVAQVDDDDDVVVVTDAQAEEEPVDEAKTEPEADTGPMESEQAAEPTAARQKLRKRLEAVQREYLAAQRDGDKKKASSLNEKAEELEMDLEFYGSSFRRKDVRGDAVPLRQPSKAKATRAMIPDDAAGPEVKEPVGAGAAAGGKSRGRTPSHLKDKSGHTVRGGSRTGTGSRMPGEIRAFARQAKRR